MHHIYQLRKEEIHPLTALRGIAALMVVTHHFGLLTMPWRSSLLGPMLQKFGLLGMTLFFVLSGFVIAYNYSDKINLHKPSGTVDFLVARIARLMPLYLLFVTGNYLYNIFVLAPSNVKNVSLAFPFNLLAIQSWVFAKIGNLELVSSQIYANISWSISTEMMLYLLLVPFGLTFFTIKKSFFRGLCLVLIAVLLRIAIVAYFQNLESEFSWWLIYYSPWGRWFEFMSGIGLAEMWVCRWQCPRQYMRIIKWLGLLSLALIILSFGNLVFFNIPFLFGLNAIHGTYAFAVPLFIFLASMQNESFFEMPLAKPLLFIGEISYSLYLLHGNLFPLPFFGGSVSDSALKIGLKGVAFFTSLIFLSYLSYRFIEIPAKRKVQKFYKLKFWT